MDFQPTDRRVLFGHHFAAIAGAGPLVGPVLAAQMGYLPGTIWIIVGVIFAGAVQDMVVLFFSMRRDGKSLGQMAREEIGPVGGAAALIAVLVDHGHPAGGAGAGRRQRAGELPVGHVPHRDDDPDRAVHGLLPARAAARAGCWRPAIGVVLLLLAIVARRLGAGARASPTRSRSSPKTLVSA